MGGGGNTNRARIRYGLISTRQVKVGYPFALEGLKERLLASNLTLHVLELALFAGVLINAAGENAQSLGNERGVAEIQPTVWQFRL